MSNKKGFSLFDITASAVCLAPVLAGILFYSQLEQKMAVHFNSDFQADGFMDKRLFLFVLPVVLTLLQLGCIAAQNIKSPFFAGAVLFKLIIPVCSYVCYFVTIGYSLGVLGSTGFLFCAVCSLLLLLAGASVPFMKKVPSFAERLFPTLKNTAVAYKTQGVSCVVWICASGILMSVSFLGSVAAPVSLIILCLVVPVIYSVAAYNSEYDKE